MGVLYSVIPLNKEVLPWLREQKVACPENVAGRNPTPREIYAAALELEDFVIEFNGSHETFTQVDIHSPNKDKGPWTFVRLERRSGIDEPADIYFEKGWPEAVVAMTLKLSHRTGPLVLLPDTGDAPAVITPDKTLSAILNEWEHTNQRG